MVQDSRIKKIFEHYGFNNQIAKLSEETQELIEVATSIQVLIALGVPADHESWAEIRKNLADEIADVRIMIDQIIYGLDLQAEYASRREFKIQRQLERMKNETN